MIMESSPAESDQNDRIITGTVRTLRNQWEQKSRTPVNDSSYARWASQDRIYPSEYKETPFTGTNNSTDRITSRSADIDFDDRASRPNTENHVLQGTNVRYDDDKRESYAEKDDGYNFVPRLTFRAATLPQDQSMDSENTASSDSDNFSQISELLHHGFRPSPLRNSIPIPKDVLQSEEILPLSIPCSVSVTFDEKPVSSFDLGGKRIEKQWRKIPNFRWFEQGSYIEIKEHYERIQEQFKRTNDIGESDEGHMIYLRHGCCSVVGTTDATKHDPDTSVITTEDLAEVVIREICRFIADRPYQKFELRLYFDWGYIRDRPKESEKFRDTMIRQYYEKMDIPKPTICNNRKYISNADITALISAEISDRLVDDDNEYGGKCPEEKTSLKNRISKGPAQTLLAICIMEGIPLDGLRHFLTEHSCSDAGVIEKLTPCKKYPLCNAYHQKLLNSRPKFFARRIEEDRWFHKISDHDIVPISFINREGRSLGEGAHSEVFEVHIDVAHRGGKSLTLESSRTYALKIFKKNFKKILEYQNAFRKEIRMLLHLAIYPHPHILTHITSWEQNSTFYILYDKANENLRDYMGKPAEKDLTALRVLWFLQQLHGLADAVRKVHQLREPAGVTPEILKSPRSRMRRKNALEDQPGDRSASKKKRKAKKTGIVGYHHDIKPENILAFGTPSSLPTLKLSDFGAGKFTAVRKHESAKPASGAPGTVTYFGPEKSSDIKPTRPFDMWALGCVFLEFLLWFLGQETPIDNQSFSSLRLEYAKGDDKVDYFWQLRHGNKDKSRSVSRLRFMSQRKSANDETKIGSDFLHPNTISRKYELNNAVSMVLDLLEKQWCKDMRAFLAVIKEIRQLLVIDPKKRMSAVNLSNHLDAILAQAEVDVREMPTYYQEMYESNHKMDGPRPKLKLPEPFAAVQDANSDISVYSPDRSISESRKGDDTDDEKTLKPVPSPQEDVVAAGSHMMDFSNADTQPAYVPSSEEESTHRGRRGGHGQRNYRRKSRSKSAKGQNLPPYLRPWSDSRHDKQSNNPTGPRRAQDRNPSPRLAIHNSLRQRNQGLDQDKGGG